MIINVVSWLFKSTGQRDQSETYVSVLVRQTDLVLLAADLT
jgi:hypothetical protein